MNLSPVDALLCRVEEIGLTTPSQAVAIAAAKLSQIALKLVGEECEADFVDGGHGWSCGGVAPVELIVTHA